MIKSPNKYRPTQPIHLCTIDPRFMDAYSGVIARAIRNYWRRSKTSMLRARVVYLFIDDQLRAFLISDTESASEQWLRDHRDWWVGTYQGYGFTENGGRIREAKVVSDLADSVREDLSVLRVD